MDEPHQDFSKLMQVARENRESSASKPARYLVTAFKPPKKESRKDATLSVGIKNFLAKKEDDLRRVKEEAEEKKRLLLEKRSEDSKAVKRVQLMRKSTKSASKAVIADAAQDTLDAVRQPDEDDYGFSSATESAMYAKMMQGYASENKNKSVTPSKKPAKNLNATKARVKEAFEREQLEAQMPHRRKRKQKQDVEPGRSSYEDYSDHEDLPPPPPAKPRKPAPPSIMNFNDMLAHAQQNIDRPMLDDDPVRPAPIKKRSPEPERLMTKKQKMEYLKEKEFLEKKAERERLAKAPPPAAPSNGQPSFGRIPKIPKLPKAEPEESKERVPAHTAEKPNLKGSKPSEKSSILEKRLTAPEKRPNVSAPEKRPIPSSSDNSSASEKRPRLSMPEKRPSANTPEKRPNVPPKPIKPPEKPTPQKQRPPPPVEARTSKAPQSQRPLQRPEGERPRPPMPSRPQTNGKPAPTPAPQAKPRVGGQPAPRAEVRPPAARPPQAKPAAAAQRAPVAGPSRPVGATAGPSKPLTMPGRSNGRPSPANGPPRPMMKGPMGNGYPPRPQRPMKKKKMAIESDSEYDSEMDDFIDDTPQENVPDLQSVLKDVFGYDKRRFQYVEEDDDDECMESSFGQISKEEFISTKTGLMEDLADIERKKRLKMMAAKKRKK